MPDRSPGSHPKGINRKKADTTNSTVTRADVPDLSFRVEENQAVKFEFGVFYTTGGTATTGGLVLALNGPALGATGKLIYGVLMGTSLTALTQRAYTAWEQEVIGGSSQMATPSLAIVRGTVFLPAGVSGEVVLRYRSKTAGIAVTILEGSYVEPEPLPII